MIPFFRKIRKKMADDNKPIKYARYAIGEITLVVIGILIALQINNWNEYRKDRALEKEILEQILGDIEIDRETLKRAMNMSNYSIESNKYILKAAKEGKEFDSILEYNFSMTTIPFSFFQAERATYDNIKSIGFQIISNKKLRKEIQYLYKRYEVADRVAEHMNLEYLNTMDLQSLQKYDLVSEHIDPTVKTGNQPLDWKTLRNDIIFMNNLANMISLHKIILSIYDEIDIMAKELQESIHKELENPH
jgi:hypothetical protein